MEQEETTTINLKRGTLNRLKSVCSRALTYDEILNKMIDLYEKQVVKTDA